MSEAKDADTSGGRSSVGRARREAIVRALADAGGRASTTYFRRETDVPRGSFDHHLAGLKERGLIVELDERDDSGRGNPSRVYRLTDDGEQRAAVLDGGDGDDRDRDELEQRVEELERQNDQITKILARVAAETGLADADAIQARLD